MCFACCTAAECSTCLEQLAFGRGAYEGILIPRMSDLAEPKVADLVPVDAPAPNAGKAKPRAKSTRVDGLDLQQTAAADLPSKRERTKVVPYTDKPGPLARGKQEEFTVPEVRKTRC